MKERIIVQQLLSFLSNDPCYRVAVLVGIRRIGKTTALLQLAEAFAASSCYIDFSKDDANEKLSVFMENPCQILLLDEITFAPNYTELIRQIEAQSVELNYKVIITGSSATHMMALYGGPLGGGRSKLYRMSLISFLEYLYFTGRIKNYDTGYEPTQEDFINYLQLNELPEGLKLTIDHDYFRTFYSDIELSNRNSTLVRSKLDLTEDDLTSLCNLLAYKLQDDVTYRTFIRPGVGDRELTPAKKRNADLSDSFLSTSIVYAKNISPESKARTLMFLIKSGLAYVDISYERKEMRNVSELLMRLEDVSAARDLEEIFNDYNICMVSPLLYTRLGEDILNRAGVDRDFLFKPNIIGMTLELYVKGTNALHRNNWNLTSYKIGAGINEVDLVDIENNLLCEITVSDKRLSDVNLNSHFVNQTMNRILSTKSVNDFVNGIRRVKYPKLCLLLDNKKIYEDSGSV
jgi:hypothetical protein